jgi:predicted Fe-Mo cluster-binding NifX family protein
MIVAVPHLQSCVNAHFGSTTEFVIATVEGTAVAHTTLYRIEGMQHDHAGIASFLKEQGVEVILAGGMGAPMQQALKQAGFAVYCGVSGPVVTAVEAFARGELTQSDATCGHHHG